MPLIRQKAARSMTWWVGVAMGALSIWVLIEGRSYGVAGLMPRVAAAGILLLAVIHTVQGLISGTVASNEEWHSAEERASYVRRRRIYIAVGLSVCIGIWLIGVHATLPIFVAAFIGIATGRVVLALILGASIWGFTYLLLGQVLHVSFPSSLLQRLLIANGVF